MEHNKWNDSYPSGGNFWSGYSSVCEDVNRGSSTPQTSGSSDGICDEGYEISSESWDNYPFTEPIGSYPPDNTAPEVDAGDDRTIKPGDTIYLNGNGSFDNIDRYDLLDFTWTINQGDNTVVTLNGMNVSHTFDDEGQFTANLTVEDNSGNVGYDTISVRVNSQTWGSPTPYTNLMTTLIIIIVIVVIVVIVTVVLVVWAGRSARRKQTAQLYSTNTQPILYSQPQQTQQDSVSSQLCRKCGSQLDPSYSICPYCGTKR
jgi:flagellar basal body-associated protein FliL